VDVSTAAYFSERRGLLSLWAGVLAGPIAFFLNLQITYMLATLKCGDATVWLHLTAVGTLALALAGGALAWRDWRRTGGGEVGDGEGAIPRSRFMSVLGMMTGALFALIIVAQWIPTFILGPCR
jgi:hypothetical protein